MPLSTRNASSHSRRPAGGGCQHAPLINATSVPVNVTDFTGTRYVFGPSRQHRPGLPSLHARLPRKPFLTDRPPRNNGQRNNSDNNDNNDNNGNGLSTDFADFADWETATTTTTATAKTTTTVKTATTTALSTNWAWFRNNHARVADTPRPRATDIRRRGSRGSRGRVYKIRS